MRFRRHREAADAATWRLLIGFSLVLLAVVAAANAAIALAYHLSFPIARGYPRLFFETNTAVVLLFVLGGCWVEGLRLREGGAHVALLAGARPAQPSGSSSDAALERRLVNVVTELSLAAGTRAPGVWVLARDTSINAFAAGWAEDDAVIAVTQGALQRLTREELQGLVGHELGHLTSGDTRLHMRLIGLVWGLQMVHGLGRSLLTRDERGRFQAGALLGLALWAVGYAGWLGGRLLQAAVSRQREFHADAAAVQFTRQVAGIGGALRKIAGLPPDRGARYEESLAHLWVSPPGKAGAAWWWAWMATHPPLGERLRRLYGRPVAQVDAPVLPPQDEPEPMLAAAPPASAGADQAGHDGDTEPATPEAPPARAQGWQRQAPTTLAREKEALARATYWRSPGERHAALLAWIIAPSGDEAPWDAWQAAVTTRAICVTRGQGAQAAYAQALRDDMRAIGPAQALTLASRLAERAAFAAPGDLAWMVRDARALAREGAPRLRRLWMLRQLLGRIPTPGRLSFEAAAGSGAAATEALSQAMGEAGAKWLQAVRAQEAVPAPPAGRGASVHPLRTVASVRRMHPMHRPRLVKSWAAAAASAGLGGNLQVLEAIAIACRLLDTPCPQPVAAALGDPQAAQPQAQDRIL